MYDTTSFDHLPDLMDFLRNLLTQPDPVVIYTHCEVKHTFMHSLIYMVYDRLVQTELVKLVEPII